LRPKPTHEILRRSTSPEYVIQKIFELRAAGRPRLEAKTHRLVDVHPTHWRGLRSDPGVAGSGEPALVLGNSRTTIGFEIKTGRYGRLRGTAAEPSALT